MSIRNARYHKPVDSFPRIVCLSIILAFGGIVAMGGAANAKSDQLMNLTNQVASACGRNQSISEAERVLGSPSYRSKSGPYLIAMYDKPECGLPFAVGIVTKDGTIVRSQIIESERHRSAFQAAIRSLRSTDERG